MNALPDDSVLVACKSAAVVSIVEMPDGAVKLRGVALKNKSGLASGIAEWMKNAFQADVEAAKATKQ